MVSFFVILRRCIGKLSSNKGHVISFLYKIGSYNTLVCLVWSLPLFSQGVDRSAINVSVAEKIYLQLASKVYAPDDIIWFKAVVTNTENNKPTELSGLLYVDLIDAEEHVVAHKLVKLVNGIGYGGFEPQGDPVHGRYLIRAYTQWNRNFGNDFFFSTYVDVVGSTKQGDNDTMGSFTIEKKGSQGVLLSGSLDPQVTGTNNPKEVQLALNWGSGRDTLRVKKRSGSDYSLQYEVPDEAQWITMSLKCDQGVPTSQTIVLNDAPLDVRFFPESGKLVHGFVNKIAFKAVGLDGKGIPVGGEVFDAKGNQVATFQSNRLGMGFFLLEADSSQTYHAKIHPKASEGNNGSTYSLPPVVSKGSILSVINGGSKDHVRIRVASNDLQGRIFVGAGCRGTDYYRVEGRLKEGAVTFELPSKGLPEGIVVLTLMDENKVPVAERLYFNTNGEDRLSLDLNTDKNEYERRQQSRLNIQVSGNDRSASNVDLSLLVIKKEQWHQGMGETIRSRLLLTSELRGIVEAPGYYFRNEKLSAPNDLDALLLTQGWRNYKYPVKRKGSSFFWTESGLNLKGVVRSISKNKATLEDIAMTALTFEPELSFYSPPIDSLGNFHFLVNDTYGPALRVRLQATNSVDKERKYTIALNKPKAPKVDFIHVPSVKMIKPEVQALVQAHARREQAKMVFDSLYGVTQLEEVVVEGYRLTPEREKAYKQFGEPDVVIEGDMIREKEKKWSYGLYSILLFNYGDQVRIERFSDGFMLAHIIGGRREPTLLVVDGKLLEKEQYEFVPHMSPDIVESVELIKYAKFFKKQYLTVFPETHILEAPSLGHIISIYTKGRIGVHGSSRPEPGTLDTMIEPFTPIKEFYAPKYDRPVPVDRQVSDLRSLLHWDPTIKTDASGKVSTSFYTGDITGDYVIIIEAISSEGHIGYAEKEFQVDGKNR